MAKFLVQKSDPLNGEVYISGAKNAVLPLMAAALLAEEKCVIDDVPALRDVEVMKDILASLGSEIKELMPGKLEVYTPVIKDTEARYELVSKMRASFLVMGPLLARNGHGKVHMPGGCTIGARPIDLHLKGFEALGAEVVLKDSYVECIAPEDGLVGASIYLDFPSVGATENIMTAAVLAKGTTYIINAAEEPEIVDLANFLNKMGAKIKGAGTDTIKIEGVPNLHGAQHTVIPDRIETATYMLAAAITHGSLLIKNVVPDHVKPITAKLRECGVQVEFGDDGMYVIADNPDVKLTATDIKTLPYPGFPTDIQSPFMAFLTTVDGASAVIETVFENRFMHVAELNRMGANIKTDGNKAQIQGGKKLEGAKVIATDLRAGAALVLAGLVADGTTEISEIYHIERGYEKFVDKFKAIGADIFRMDE
ncbi:UDP-N-acetylglucosamine 1-carboxyvinyltransferase [Peptostreptococcaceae bacterium pGA-8]|nr:UDP-N-acetylglucosamine 1-carboxyvinyltransferase [Peptostreptococcaceae bacterium pGA-8]